MLKFNYNFHIDPSVHLSGTFGLENCTFVTTIYGVETLSCFCRPQAFQPTKVWFFVVLLFLTILCIVLLKLKWLLHIYPEENQINNPLKIVWFSHDSDWFRLKWINHINNSHHWLINLSLNKMYVVFSNHKCLIQKSHPFDCPNDFT